MKKLFITAVFALGSLTAFAQEETATEVEETATEAATETEDAAQDAAAGAEDAAVGQDGFSEIAVEEVPEAVSSMIETNYPGATINAAHKNEENHYKVEVSLEDGTSGALIVDEEGNAIEQ